MGLVNNQDAYVKHMIWDSGQGNIHVHNHSIGFYFMLRMPNYRGNYLSCVEHLSFKLDGIPVDNQNVTFILNNKRFTVDSLPVLFAEYWDTNALALIEVLKDGGLSGKHELEACMHLRYAYSAYFGVCKVVTSHCVKNLVF